MKDKNFEPHIRGERMDEEPQKSEEQYRRIVESANEGIAVAQDGILKYFNPKLMKMTGYSKEELISKPFVELIHPDDREMTIQDHLKGLKGEDLPQVIPFRFVDKKGDVKWFEVKAAVIDWEGRSATLTFISDITDRREVDDSFKESEKNYRELIETSLDMILKLDLQGNFLFTNRAWQKRIGYSEDEAKKMNGFELIHPEDLKTTQRGFAEVIQGKSIENLEFRSKTKAGSLVNILINASPIFDSQGNVCAILGVARDVTERKKTEKVLSQQAAFMKNNPAPMLQTDYSGIIIGYNPAAGKLFQKDLTGEPVYGVIPQFDEINIQHIGEEQLLQAKQKLADKTYLFTIRKDRTTNSIYIYGSDITKLRKVEEAITKQKERAERHLNIVGSIIVALDAKGKITLMNRKGYEILGYNEGELIGEDWFETCLPEKNVEEVKQVFRKCMQGERRLVEHYENPVMSKAKEKRVINWYNTLLKDKEGKIIGILSSGEDITDRKRAEEALKESEKRYRMVSELTSDYVTKIKIDPKNNMMVEMITGGFTRISGFKIDDIRTPSDWRKIFHKDDLDKFSNFLKDVVSQRTSEIEIRGLTKKGEIRWLHVYGQSEWDKNRKPCGLILAASDITDKKKAEEALRASEAQLSNAMKIAKLGYWEYDVADDLFTFNDHFYAIFRTSAEKVGGYKMSPARYVQLFLHPADAEAVAIEMKKALETTDPNFSRQLEHRIIYADGNVGHISVRYFVIKDNQGRTVKTYGANQDITDRKKAEERIKMFQASIEDAYDGIALTQMNGDVIYANKAACKIFGYSSSEIIRLNVSAFNEDPEDAKQLEEAVIKKGGWSGEITGVRKNKERFPAMLSVSVIKDEKGKPVIRVSVFRDITEYKKTTEALQKSQALLVEAQRIAHFGNWNWEIEENKLSWSDEIYRIFGVESQEFGADFDAFFNAVHPEDKEIVRKTVDEAVREGKPINFEHRIVLPDGKVRIVHEQGEVFYDQSRKPIRLVGTVQDITKRKMAEEALKESEEKFRNLAEESPNMIFINSKGKIVYANRKCEEVMGYTKEEFYSPDFDFFAFITPESKEKVKASFGRHMKGEEIPPLEYGLITRKGEKIVAILTTKLMKYEGESAFLGIATDITDRKRAEEALKESENKYRTLLENIPQRIFLKDRNSVYMSCNENYAKDLKIPPDEISGKNDYDFYPEKLAEKYRADDKRIMESGDVEDMEEEYIQDGQEAFVHTVKTPVKDAHGNAIGILGIFWDITERKKLQQQLIQSEKLAAVGTLAYGIAHEFNNILAGMMANAEFGLITKEPQQIKECFETIAENSKRASSITNNLLVFTREKEARRELTNITQPLRSVLAITRRELEKANIEIVEEISPIPKIFCDPGQFSEVFLNMITNARDAMLPEGGSLTVGLKSQSDKIRIMFRDTGSGIPDKIKRKIFDPFVTTKGALGKSDIPGTGLGLFLTYGIIDSYQGKIEVETEEGKGTQFTILIPISKNLPREPLVETVIKPTTEIPRKLNILLVDDERPICITLKRFLESKGHRVFTSLRAREGLEHFKKDKFDVVLSDITMPDMDGIELVKRIRKIDKEAKIIVMTGHIQREKEEQAKDAGADEVLVKPFKNEFLYQKIAKIIL